MTQELILTSEATLAFPNVAEAKADKKGNMKYSAVLLFDKAKSSVENIKALIIKTRNAKWSDPAIWPSLKLGLKDGDKPNTMGKIPNGFAGHWVVNVTSKYKPTLGDEFAKPFMGDAKEKFYPGCKVIAQVNAFSYSDSGNAGVGIGLQCLQFVGHGKRLVEHADVSRIFTAVPGSAAAGAGNGDSLDDFKTQGAAAPKADPWG